MTKYTRVKNPNTYTEFVNIQCCRKSKVPYDTFARMPKNIKRRQQKYISRFTEHLKASVKDITNEYDLAYFIYSHLGVSDPVNGDWFIVYHRTYTKLPYTKVRIKANMHRIAEVWINGTDPFKFVYKYSYIRMDHYSFWKGKENKDTNETILN